MRFSPRSDGTIAADDLSPYPHVRSPDDLPMVVGGEAWLT
jgi:hypothetical protein